MKSYWSIPGTKDSASIGLPCLAFYKSDGSNIRAEYHRKRGWYKFGTRNVLIDRTNPDFGLAIDLFMNTLAEGIEKVLQDNKVYRGNEGALAFFEFYGPNSFAGWHNPIDPKEVTLFDVNINKKGFVLPRDFADHFGHLKSAPVVYDGNFSLEFISAVREGKIAGLKEGVVAKGITPGCKRDQHGLWMAKIKTNSWLSELKQKAAIHPELYKNSLTENLHEQEKE